MVSCGFLQGSAKTFLRKRTYYTGEGIANKNWKSFGPCWNIYLRGVHANERLFTTFWTCNANTLISINLLGVIFWGISFLFFLSFFLSLFFFWNRVYTFSYHSVPCSTPCPNGCVTARQTKPCQACLRGCVINAGGGYLIIIDVAIFHSKWRITLPHTYKVKQMRAFRWRPRELRLFLHVFLYPHSWYEYIGISTSFF